jgi:DNA-binding response OmpR family regulator
MSHVLIADASNDVAQLVAAALGRRGFATEIRVPGAKPARPPDVLVLDAGLRDAVDLVGGLRTWIPRLPVVATGIRSLDGQRPPLGALIYLVKPFSLTDLAAAVRAAAPT